MKPFNIFVVDVNDGKTNAALTAALAELIKDVQSTGKSGSLGIQVKIYPGSKPGTVVDRITVVVDHKLTLPKPEQPTDFFFATEDGDLTRNHPRQHSLDLRDAQDTRGGFKQVVDDKPTFSTPDADGVITPKEAQQ